MAYIMQINQDSTLYEINPLSTASIFDATTTYAKGDYVFYDGTLYRFNTAHSAGAWSSTEVNAVTIATELNDRFQRDEADNMTVGNAEQLIAHTGITDTEPYFSRPSASIGDREFDTLVGGSLGWNQLVQNGNFESADNWNIANATGFSVLDGVASFTPTAQYGNLRQSLTGKPLKANHVVFCVASIKADETLAQCQLVIGDNTNFTSTKEVTANTSWQTVSLLINKATVASANNHSISIRTTLTSDFGKIYVKNVNVIDLTTLFGSTIADYIYSLEQATAGAGVAWVRKYLPETYYAYCAPTLKHVTGVSAHVMRGFNQWDEEYQKGYYTNTGAFQSDNTQLCSKNKINVVPGSQYYLKIGSITGNAASALCYYDKTGTFIERVYQNSGVFTVPENVHFINANFGTVYGGTYQHDICINLSDASKNGTYEPYVQHSYPIDSTWTGMGIPKLDSANKLYFDGDRYASDGTVTVKFVEGTITIESIYVRDGNANCDFGVFAIPEKWAQAYQYFGTKTKKAARGYDAITDAGDINVYDSNNKKLTVSVPKGYTLEQAKAMFDGSGFVYEKQTPTTSSASPFTSPQIVDDFGTEEYVTTGLVPVGHETLYPIDIRGTIETISETPTTDGTYTLKCTVSGGVPTMEWVADT